MNFRPFGARSGLTVPRANIGAMRLPKDDDEAVALIRHAIDSGMVYIDTCRSYGDSELKLAKALKDGWRERVILSTKWSPWVTQIEPGDDASADCIRRRIEDSMRRLQVDRLDFYQVWSLNSPENYEAATRKGGMVDGIRKAMDEGLVGHIGFTTHDTPANLLRYLPDLDWAEVVLMSYNLLNTTYEPVLKAYHEAGIGTIVMNPVGGGRLKEASQILAPLASRVGALSVPDLAIRFIMSNPAIDTIITGMERPSDVDDSIASARMGGFGGEQMGMIRHLISEIAARQAEFCTNCGYCKPCPQGIDIPAVLACLFDDRFWGLREAARARYLGIQEPKADSCIRCGECESKCTQHLSIMDELEDCRKLFGEA